MIKLAENKTKFLKLEGKSLHMGVRMMKRSKQKKKAIVGLISNLEKKTKKTKKMKMTKLKIQILTLKIQLAKKKLTPIKSISI